MPEDDTDTVVKEPADVPFIGTITTIWVVGIVVTLLALIIDIALAVTSIATTETGASVVQHDPLLVGLSLAIPVYVLTLLAAGALRYAYTYVEGSGNTTRIRDTGYAVTIVGTGVVAIIVLVIVDQRVFTTLANIDSLATAVEQIVPVYRETMQNAAIAYSVSAGGFAGYAFRGRITDAVLGALFSGLVLTVLFFALTPATLPI